MTKRAYVSLVFHAETPASLAALEGAVTPVPADLEVQQGVRMLRFSTRELSDEGFVDAHVELIRETAKALSEVMPSCGPGVTCRFWVFLESGEPNAAFSLDVDLLRLLIRMGAEVSIDIWNLAPENGSAG